MPARATYSDAPAFRADRDMRDAAKIAVDGNDRAQLALIALDGGTRPAQISQALLTHIGCGDDIGICLYTQLIKYIYHADHSGDIDAIIADAGAAQDISLAFDENRRRLWKYGISMCQQHQ